MENFTLIKCLYGFLLCSASNKTERSQKITCQDTYDDNLREGPLPVNIGQYVDKNLSCNTIANQSFVLSNHMPATVENDLSSSIDKHWSTGVLVILSESLIIAFGFLIYTLKKYLSDARRQMIYQMNNERLHRTDGTQPLPASESRND